MCDGWCEQGGQQYGTDDATQTVTLLVPYKDTDYIISTNDYLGQLGESRWAFATINRNGVNKINIAYQSGAGTSWNVAYRTAGYIDLDTFTSLNSGT